MNMPHTHNPGGQAVFRLVVLEGLDRGKITDLDINREYLVGRAEECDIRIDLADKTVSRNHARLKVTEKQIVIENLSATNPVLINGKPVQKAALKDKGQFRIGESLFALEKTSRTTKTGKTANTGKPAKAGAAPKSGKSAPPLRIILAAVLVLICAGVVIIIMTGGNKQPVPANMDMTKPSADKPAAMQPILPGKDMTDSGFKSTGLTVSAEDMKAADQHFRQGMFFYDTGNISRAVDEWNRAIVLYPDHPDAQSWFLRAEKELEEKIKTHYQNAMVHYKYMRYRDAAHEFRLVVELSRDKNNDQYINSLKTLNEIEGR